MDNQKGVCNPILFKDGEKTIKLNNESASSMGGASIAVLSNKNIVAAWSIGSDEKETFLQILDTEGNRVGNVIENPVQLHDTISKGGKHDSFMKLNALSDGFLMVYSNHQVYAQIFDPSGEKIGDNIQIAPDNISVNVHYNTILSNDNFVFTWSVDSLSSEYCKDDCGIFAQIFDSSGNKVGNNIKISSLYVNQSSYKTAALSGGNFVVTWTSKTNSLETRGLFAQVFDSFGQKIGEELKVNDKTGYVYEENLSIAARSDDSFIIVWDYEHNGSYQGSYGQEFSFKNKKIEKISNNQSISDPEQENPGLPTIKHLNSSAFLVSWLENYNSEGTTTSIVASLVSDLKYIGSAEKLALNDHFTARLDHIEKTIELDGGSSIVFWEGYSTATQLFFQHISNNGEKIGDTALINGNSNWGVGPHEVQSLSNNRFAYVTVDTSPDDIYHYYAYLSIYDCDYPCNIQPNDKALTTLQYISAKLSLEVYESGGTLPSGWSVLLSSDDPNVPKAAKVSHYFGKAYINEHNEVIISHRGTDVSILHPTSFKDLFSDLEMVFNYIPNHYVAAEAFINYIIKEYLCDNDILNAKISITGHSLGAALAELTAAHFHFPAITFESPGTSDIIHNHPSFNALKSDLKFSDSDIKYAQNNIISYNDAPDFINSMAGHIGQMIRIFPSFVIYPGEKDYDDEIGRTYALTEI